MNTIVIRGKEFPILFDQQNMKEIQKKFGNLTAVVKKLNGGEIETVSWVLWIMIREGVLLRNDELGTHDAPPSYEHISRLVTVKDLSDPVLITALTDTFQEYLGGNVSGQQLTAVGMETLTAARNSSKLKMSSGKTSKQKSS